MSAISSICSLNGQPLAVEYGPRVMDGFAKFPADYVGMWQQNDVFLGCHGQWITPESLSERLPSWDEASGLAITADAIIDNRTELFDLLHIPASDRAAMTDSRLLLLAYEKWGNESPEHLVGDFAFMIWDARKRTLFGARDFSGNRTLYYTTTGEFAAFSTTIAPLLSLPGVERGLNELWLSEFLAIPITTEAVDVSSTVYKTIRQLPPAHSFTLREGHLSFSRYCTIAPMEKIKLRSNGEYEEAFRDVFRKAVSSRIRTYREVGANLSGGLDSGSVVSFAARELRTQNKLLHTFSYVPVDSFADWTPRSRVANEKEHIQDTVQYVGNIHDQYFDFAEHNPLSEIDDWLDLMETPYKFYENSYWMKGIYKKASEAGAGVLLTGSRGNWTISWGPAQDYQAALLRKFKLWTLYREFNQYSVNINANRIRLRNTIGRKAFPALARLMSAYRNEPVLPELIHPEFARRTKVYERLEEYGYDFWGDPSQNVYDVRRKHFEKLYSWTITGTAGCKQSLSHSMWERDASNDLRVIRFCLSVPENQYVQNGYGRSLIRRATQGYLPDTIRLNQRVRGIQGADGLHRMTPRWNELLHEFRETIDDPDISELLNRESLGKALASVGNVPRPEIVFDTEFRILMRALIFRRFLKRNA
ncbi:asparagine synthase-related protein [Paenibacillus sp. PAMC21692]|uniref:asparagine synthase-related protein n=1 Tax=Paenibacillus sp. PAMC21692 TaxID=2762320 RepID=UPI00164D1F3F|nr:asparagine synthase-related protein [Paenibacillus sp. PAMC21692]QNK59906.1 asparagine synthetase B [Paenibacillus sp. PAMC21692]